MVMQTERDDHRSLREGGGGLLPDVKAAAAACPAPDHWRQAAGIPKTIPALSLSMALREVSKLGGAVHSLGLRS